MRTQLQNILYFTLRLGGYGFLAGALFGSLIYPIFGAFMGVPLGLTAGIALGLLFGVGIPIYERYALTDNLDVEQYAGRLALGTGLIATFVSALPLAFIFAPVAGFTSAYVAHHYAYRRSPLAQKPKNDFFGSDHRQRRQGVVRRLTRDILARSFYVSVPAAAILFLMSAFGGNILVAVGAAIFTLIWGTAFAWVIGLINGFFIAFLNRLIFEPELTKEAYKRRVSTIVGVLTLFLGSIVTLGIGAPFAAVAAGFAANQYADWYYAETEKPKRDKLKNSDRLALRGEDPAEAWLAEDFLDEVEEERDDPGLR